MSIMIQPILILVIISLIMYIVLRTQLGTFDSPNVSESFATGREKAEAVSSWFANTRAPSYVGFRADVNRGSDRVDIVDYYKASRAQDKTAGALESILN
jgi:uncharacterized membrane protein YhhN